MIKHEEGVFSLWQCYCVLLPVRNRCPWWSFSVDSYRLTYDNIHYQRKDREVRMLEGGREGRQYASISVCVCEDVVSLMLTVQCPLKAVSESPVDNLL